MKRTKTDNYLTAIVGADMDGDAYIVIGRRKSPSNRLHPISDKQAHKLAAALSRINAVTFNDLIATIERAAQTEDLISKYGLFRIMRALEHADGSEDHGDRT